MLQELSYFDYLETDLRSLQEKSKDLNEMLSNAYTSPQKTYCSLKEQIDNILLQEQQLQTIISIIIQQVLSNTFVPAKLQSHQIDQLFPSYQTLPKWFPHVLEAEYSKHKQELDLFALNLSSMHELKEKKKMMRQERENLQLLNKRTLQIRVIQSRDNFSDIDIIQDVNHLKNRIKHVRKAYQHFCSQVSAKITEFITQLIAKTKGFTEIHSKMQLKSDRRVFTNENDPINSNHFQRSDYSNNQVDKSRHFFRSLSPRQCSIRSELPNQSFKPKNVTKTNQMDFQSKVQKQFRRLDQYKQSHATNDYNIPQDYRGLNKHIHQYNHKRHQNPLANCPQHSHHSHNYHKYAHKCSNHEKTSTHKHTCQKGQSNWFRAIKSAERITISPSQRKFDYRHFIKDISPSRQYYF